MLRTGDAVEGPSNAVSPANTSANLKSPNDLRHRFQLRSQASRYEVSASDRNVSCEGNHSPNSKRARCTSSRSNRGCYRGLPLRCLSDR